MNQSELGLRIKQCRKSNKLTQEQLAEIINVSPHYIYEIEKGMKSMSLSTLAELSIVLHVSTDYLLFGMNVIFDSSNFSQYDRLDNLTRNLTTQKRDSLADIISAMLPHLK